MNNQTGNSSAPPEPHARGKNGETTNGLLAGNHGETTLDGGTAGATAGKAASASNALRHGLRASEWLADLKRVNHLLRECRQRLEKP